MESKFTPVEYPPQESRNPRPSISHARSLAVALAGEPRLGVAGLGFSLQGNSKTQEGCSHPDRDAQFRYIDAAATRNPVAAMPRETSKTWIEMPPDFELTMSP